VASSPDSLGILGGSFDPPHIAHLLIAQAAYYRFRLSRVIFSPAATNPLKEATTEPLATADQRLAMLRLATENDSRFAVDAHEVRKGGYSYTIDTLRRYRGLYPDTALYFLLGADAAATLPQWKEVAAFGELCTLAIYPRPDAPDFSNGLPAELEGFNLRYEHVPLECWPISSSGIRRRLRDGKPVRYYVPDAVTDFVYQTGVYR
jgi:nicotinate-nucleotide adenylyltransferase